MIKAKEKAVVVAKVSTIDTLRLVQPGTSVTFDCREAGSMATARSAISRLNQAEGARKWSVTTTDNGATYTVTRSA